MTSRSVGGAERPKVAFILSRFPYLTETFIVSDIAELTRAGEDVTVFSLLPPKHKTVSGAAARLLPLVRYSSMWSWRIARSQLLYLASRPGRYLGALESLIRQTWREPAVLGRGLLLFPMSVDIARQVVELGIGHVHANFVWIEALAAGVVQDLTDVPFSIRPHAFGLFSRNRGNVKAQLTKAAHVVTISEYHRSYAADIMEADPMRVSVVHLGIDTSQYAPVEVPAEAPVRILSIGRGVEKKGHRHLVEACAVLRERRADFTCEIILGRGTEREALEDLVDELELRGLVSLLDLQDPDSMRDRYRAADVFALACVVARNGDRDGMPYVLLEAMACGLPVVTSPVAGIPELVSDGVNGFLVKERDAVGLADALERMIEDPQLRRTLGKRGRATIEEKFEARQTAAQLMQVFQRYSTPTGSPSLERVKQVGGSG